VSRLGEPIDPAFSRNSKPPPFRRWSVHRADFAARLAHKTRDLIFWGSSAPSARVAAVVKGPLDEMPKERVVGAMVGDAAAAPASRRPGRSHREVPALEVLELEIDGAVFGGQPAGPGRCGGDVNDASRKGVATCRATTHARGVIRLLSIAENMTMTIMERLGPASCRPAGKSSQPRPTDRSRNSAAATSTRRLNNLMGIHFQSAPMGCRRLKVVLTSDSIVTIFIGGNVSK
jgi:hypothetical protein